MKTPKEILIEAKSLIEQGWVKGMYWEQKAGDPDAPVCYCLLGALSSATLQEPKRGFISRFNENFELNVKVRHIYAEAINLHLFYKNGSDLHSWNDAPERTKEEVLKGFDLAIEIASVAKE